MAGSSKQALLSPEGFEGYNAKLQTVALKATRNAAVLPADLKFFRSLDRGLAKEVDVSSSKALSLANRLLHLVSTAETSSSRAKGKGRLEDDDDVTDSFRSLVVDAMDQLLERADICIDETLGLSKPPAIEVNAKPTKQKTTKTSTTSHGRLDPALQHASNLPKPQLKFKRKVDNSASHWRPALKHKYNAQVPLGYDLREDEDESMEAPSHPYRHEIKNISYPSRMFRYAEAIPPKSFEATPFKWVSSPGEVSQLLDHLRGAPEIAVDLEYHSYRSYYGFVCLMQISTRAGDWIVDTLAVRDELEELNEVFTDPNIVKVFHGAESDIVWLQQDFNLYIVNLFDTYHASKVLEFPRHGLAHLMEMYCDFTPDKRYQLADWRIRPLPQEMIEYARSDTHYLLFIYDHLRNALLDRSNSRIQSRAQTPSSADIRPSRGSTPSDDVKFAFVREVLSRSEDTALRVYEKDKYHSETGSGPGGWDTLARKWNKGALMASERLTAKARIYRAVHTWRDRAARDEDESTGYILPNRNVFMLAEQPPSDMAGLLSKFHHINPVLRRRSKELLDTIRKAAKEHESVTAIAISEEKAPEVAQDAVEIDQTASGITPPLPTEDPATNLWPRVDGQSLRATSSSLFGAPITVHKQTESAQYIASKSTLFADLGEAKETAVRRQRFLSAVVRIHEGLLIAPTAPKTAQPVTAVEKVEPEPGIVGAQAEIPFVPASERQEGKTIAPDGPVKDSIVVVGQAPRKKRKRTKGESGTSKEEEGGSEAFDYSTVSNILDEGSDHENAGDTRKRKQRTQGRFDYGNFRAPPKAEAQVQSGNQSRTFKQ